MKVNLNLKLLKNTVLVTEAMHCCESETDVVWVSAACKSRHD